MSLLGGTGVGRTSLIRFLNGLPFDPNLPPSHQRLRVWDICGECETCDCVRQWVVMSMSCASLYYTHSEIILLCYAINDAVSARILLNPSRAMISR